MYLRFIHPLLALFTLTSLIPSCTNKNQVFRKLSSQKTGIHFNNVITENDSMNILDMEYVYNGGGVAIADFNNDHLPDVFFTGNMVSNRLYLNEGNLHFRDVTAAAGLAGKNKWCTGVATVDINNDGLMDMYVCASIKHNAAERANMLLINKGPDKNGVPQFVDEAAAYHLADTSYSTNAAFFDYDNDGDLDLYIVTNKMVDSRFPNEYRKKTTDGHSPNTDILYRNDWDSALGHAVYTNVSQQAGIVHEGFGLGINITDINRDGWKDIYVTNDFLTNDLLYINNHDGTFTNKAGDYFKHTSYSAMGNDVADINNDGLMDIIALDMLPETNYRKKMMMPANNYQMNLNNDQFKYEYQYARNTLQLNQGPAVKAKDSVPEPVFSDIAFYAGVAQTDWSWTPMVTDFDNDGFRDIIITNGFPKDVTDHDFMTFRANASKIATKQEMLEQIPAVKLHNFAFRNNGNLSFTNVSEEWGMMEPSFSNGAAYADLDNDGDLDFIVNNINDKAMVYENLSSHGKESNHYLQIKFQGGRSNINGIGAWAELHYDHGKLQACENSPYRGYLSSMQNIAHFGLGKIQVIDSVIIKWPDGNMQLLKNVPADQVLQVAASDARLPYTFLRNDASQALFREVSDSLNVHVQQEENDFSDFTIQKLLPHKFTQYGPGLAVGDVDGNGLDDVVCGGSLSFSPRLLLQQPDGKFTVKEIIPGANKTNKKWEDLGLLLFDADGDGDLDLYTASGGYESQPGTNAYADKLYINDGKGNFLADSMALPKNFTSKSCVRAVDFDKDGDLDIFVAGRVEPWNYPKPVSSYIYRNDSKPGHVQFTDVTATVAKDLNNIGLTCDAVWTDFDNDGWPDLMLAGEWMPVTFFKNDKGILKKISAPGIGGETGFWNSIAPGDFDNDGDIDYVVGNMGQNSYYTASKQYPVKIYAKDFDDNGNYDAIPSLYLPDDKGDKKEYPAQTRDDLIRQIIGTRMKFQNYRSFANATMDKVLTTDELKGALVLQAQNLKTCLIRNNGNGSFDMIPLPVQAQVSSINGMVAEDFDGDGNLDIVMNGNDFGTEVSVGRYDALNGLYLKGDGKGGFLPQAILKSGIYIPGNGKALVKAKSAGGGLLLVASQNRAPLKIFALQNAVKTIPVLPADVSAVITYKNGRKRREEFYYGSSFLSQSARFLHVQPDMTAIEITDSRGKHRKVNL